jgi:hypothetical protein
MAPGSARLNRSLAIDAATQPTGCAAGELEGKTQRNVPHPSKRVELLASCFAIESARSADFGASKPSAPWARIPRATRL